MSLIQLRWAVSMGRVSTEPGKKCLFAQLDRPTNQSEQRSMLTFTEFRRKDGKNIFDRQMP